MFEMVRKTDKFGERIDKAKLGDVRFEAERAEEEESIAAFSVI